MKRLLLATLLLGLLIPDSAFANRSKIKQQENASNKEKFSERVNEREKKKIEKFISLCNNADKPGNNRDYVYCYKVTGEYREKITSKSFIESAKELSRERLDACIRPKKFKYGQELNCRYFLNEPHTYWIRNEVSKEEYDLVEKYVSEFDLKEAEELERLRERYKYTNIDKELKKYKPDGSKLDLFFYCQKQQQNIMATREEMNKECGRIPL